MSQATRPNDRHIIWSNQNLDVDDWREDYKEFLEANELDDDPNDEQALYEWMEETNYDYLSDERVNLNVQLSQPIIVIGDIGRWNGRVMGYKDIPSGNIRDCLYGRENKESEMQGAYTTEFGFRADTEKYAFVLRCNPTRGDYNFYCLCYVKEWLDKHIEEANRDIRFIDSHYKELFRIPDGERIIVTDRDGKTESYPCRYIDNYHTEVGCNLFHICEFAERMEQGGCTYAPMEPPLPPMCYSVLPSTGEVIQIDRWQKGYTATSFNDGNRAENEAIKDKFNEKLGVSKAQEQAMLAGSMIRWDSIAAKPKSYDENGKAIKPKDYER